MTKKTQTNSNQIKIPSFTQNYMLTRSLILLVLCALGLLAYLPSFNSSFQFDDIAVIVDNPVIKMSWPTNISSIWNEFNTRFLIGITLSLNYYLGQLNPFGYHVFNFAIHLLNAFFVFLIAKELSVLLANKKNSSLFSFICAVIFLLHPMQTQAVTYIWQRCIVLATFFYLLAIFASIGQDKRGPFWYMVSVLAALGAVFCKELIVTLPIVIFVLRRTLIKEAWIDSSKRVIPILIIVMLVPLIYSRPNRNPSLFFKPPSAQKALVDNQSIKPDLLRWATNKSMSRSQYYQSQPTIWTKYLSMWVFPIAQNVDHDIQPTKGIKSFDFLFNAMVLVLICLLAFVIRKRDSIPILALFWFAATLSIESVIPFEDLFFEHRLYLPSVGLSFLYADIIVRILAKRKVILTILLALIITLLFVTYQRNLVWKTPISLWKDSVLGSPNKIRPKYSLGAAYARQGRFVEAVNIYEEALKLDPQSAVTLNNLGEAKHALGHYEEARQILEQAIELRGDLPKPYNNLAATLMKLNEPQKAMVLSNKALELDPWLAEAHNNLGILYTNTQNNKLALNHFKKASALKPNSIPILYNSALEMAKLGLRADANELIQKILLLNPNHDNALALLGYIWWREGDSDKAISFWQKSLSINPNNETTKNYLKDLLAVNQG